MTLIDTEHMRDRQGRSIKVGMTVMAMRHSSKTGVVFDFHGVVCATRKTATPGRLEALVQPHRPGEAKWLRGGLVELPQAVHEALEGVLGEWVE